MKIDETEVRIDYSMVILWQYDHSDTLIMLLNAIKTIADITFTNHFNDVIKYVINLDLAGIDGDPLNGLGLELWGDALGLKRPCRVNNSVVDTSAPIGNDAYRRILKARLALAFSNADGAATRKYMYDIFGTGATLIDNCNSNNGVMTVSLASDASQISDPDLANLAESKEGVEQILVLPQGVWFKTSVINSAGTFGLNVSDKTDAVVGQNLENFATQQSDNYGGTFDS